MEDATRPRSELLEELRSLREQLRGHQTRETETRETDSELAARALAQPGFFRCDRAGQCAEVDDRWCEITGVRATGTLVGN